MPDNASQTELAKSIDRGHEQDHLAAGWVTGLGIGLLLLVIAVTTGIAVVCSWLLLPRRPGEVRETWSHRSEGAGVQPNQAYDRVASRTRKERHLHQYGWQDKERGIVHIPIERAIEIMAESNLRFEGPSSESPSATPVKAGRPDQTAQSEEEH